MRLPVSLLLLGLLQVFPWVGVFVVFELGDSVALSAAGAFLIVYAIPAVLVWRSVIPTARSGNTALLATVVLTGLNMVVAPFAAIHRQLSENVHECFNEVLSWVDALYFTLTTLTTTGYGDIKATDSICRIAVSAQMIVDAVIFVGVVALAITHYASGRERTPGGADEET